MKDAPTETAGEAVGKVQRAGLKPDVYESEVSCDGVKADRYGVKGQERLIEQRGESGL